MSQKSRSSTFLAPMTLTQIADVAFPTRWAEFRLRGFEALHANGKTRSARRETALALMLGDVHTFPPIVRIHSQCITGEVFHSLRCDCHDQLHLALSAIAEEGAGVLVYERQEGRGIGLMEKLRAYELQDQGLDTVEANLRLGHEVDSRDYALAVQILHFLKIRSLRLISNNPDKVKAVVSSGIEIVERIGADVPRSVHSTNYLATKRNKLGHLSNPVCRSLIQTHQTSLRLVHQEPCGNSARSGAVIGTERGGDPWQMS